MYRNLSDDIILSIVTVARNDATRLKATVASVMRQNAETPYEHLVIDGGSTDGSVAFLKSVCTSHERLRFISEEDGGIYDAMNKGVSSSYGQFVYFLNAGDVFVDDDALADVVSELHLSSPWAVCRVQHMGNDGRFSRNLPFRKGRLWSGRQEYNHQGTIFRADLFRAFGGYDLRFGFMADLHLMLKYSIAGSPQEIDRAIAIYEGAGVSAPLIAKVPRVLHLARVNLLGLQGSSRLISACFAILQTIRRDGLRVSFDIWSHSPRGGFRDPNGS